MALSIARMESQPLKALAWPLSVTVMDKWTVPMGEMNLLNSVEVRNYKDQLFAT